MPMDSYLFAKSMIQQAEEFGQYMDDHILSNWNPEMDQEQNRRLMETQAWREFYLGVPTVARQATSDRGLRSFLPWRLSLAGFPKTRS